MPCLCLVLCYQSRRNEFIWFFLCWVFWSLGKFTRFRSENLAESGSKSKLLDNSITYIFTSNNLKIEKPSELVFGFCLHLYQQYPLFIPNTSASRTTTGWFFFLGIYVYQMYLKYEAGWNQKGNLLTVYLLLEKSRLPYYHPWNNISVASYRLFLLCDLELGTKGLLAE